MKYKHWYLWVCIMPLFWHACDRGVDATPKQRMFPKIDFPDTVYYTKIRPTSCAFSFDMPSYFQYVKDSFYFDEKAPNDCWFNLQSKQLNTTLHCSYYQFHKKADLDSLISDAFDLTNKHNVKANARKESIISSNTTESKVGGILFEVDGDVASPLQFFLTDSTKNFIRGSLYFNAKVDQDSTAPVYDFIKKDIVRLVQSLEWNKK